MRTARLVLCLFLIPQLLFGPYLQAESLPYRLVDRDRYDIFEEERKAQAEEELIIKDVAFDSIIHEIKTGKSDFGAAGISYSEERAEQVMFSIDYAESKQVVLVKNNSNITDKNDIKNKKIAVQLGSVADTYVTEKYKKAEIIRQKKYLATIQDL